MTKEILDALYKPFKITSVSRADIVQMFIDNGMDRDECIEKALSFSDLEMMEIAEQMADSYMENSFWGDLETISEYIKDEEKEDEDA